MRVFDTTSALVRTSPKQIVEYLAKPIVLVLCMQTQNDYKVINMDQWMGFYRFCNEVSLCPITIFEYFSCLILAYCRTGRGC